MTSFATDLSRQNPLVLAVISAGLESAGTAARTRAGTRVYVVSHRWSETTLRKRLAAEGVILVMMDTDPHGTYVCVKWSEVK